MNIIKHGSLYREEAFKCPMCKCEYTAFAKECQLSTFINRRGQMVYETSCSCPECHNKNFKYKKEGDTE